MKRDKLHRAIVACGGDAREALKALLIANQFRVRTLAGFASRQQLEPLSAHGDTSEGRE
jgi:hypothetical protein